MLPRRCARPGGVPELQLAPSVPGPCSARPAATTSPPGRCPRPPDPSTGADANAATGGGEDPAPLAPAIAVEWVAEVWVDPDWYAAQDERGPCPSPGLPAVVPLRGEERAHRAAVDEPEHPPGDRLHRRRGGQPPPGAADHRRRSGGWSRTCSRRTAPTSGRRAVPLPTDPVAPGQRRELAEDDRVYVGAWTRIVVRRATPEERGQ